MRLNEKLLEVYNSRYILGRLLMDGEKKVKEIRDSGNLEMNVKGRYESGEVDEISRPDRVVGQFYFESMKGFPVYWHAFIEDHPHQPDPSSFQEGDIGVWWDPLDGTKLLKEGKRGYSTMVGVAVNDGEGFRPVLGMFKIIDTKEKEGEFVWAYFDGTNRYFNFTKHIVERPQREKLVLGRTSVERKGLLTPIAKALGCDVEYIRGMAPQTLALLMGKTDFFIYEPGIGLSDVMPIAPIVRAFGGDVCDLKGNNIIYTGNPELDKGVIISGKKRGKIGLENGILGVNIPTIKNDILAKTKRLIA